MLWRKQQLPSQLCHLVTVNVVVTLVVESEQLDARCDQHSLLGKPVWLM